MRRFIHLPLLAACAAVFSWKVSIDSVASCSRSLAGTCARRPAHAGERGADTDRIASVRAGDQGEYVVTMADGQRLASSRSYSARVRSLLR